ncbi:MAG TPA: glycosyltransferase family 87 protein [Terriglobales bacterium]|nr:glycosyltransferase family 87 protein [Terriglobales bacterium]
MKISQEWRVYILGAMLCLALTLCSLNFSDRGGPRFMASLTLAGVVYLLAMRVFFASPLFRKRVVVVGLVLAAVWHIEFLRLPAGADDDVHRYVWDGRLQRLGYNPYLVVPIDPAVKALHTPETRSLNHPELPSLYPAGAELFFRAVTAIHESTFAMKAAFVLCELSAVFVLLDVLRRRNLGAHLVLAFAWNPLLALEVAGSGHIDILGALLLLVSVGALMRRWREIAAVAFGLAVAVKLLPIVLLPLYWKRVRIRDAALAVAVVGLLYLPFLNHGRIPIGSVGVYVQSFRFNDPVFAILERVAPPQLIAGFAVLIGLVTAMWLRSASSEWSTGAVVWPMAASLFCAPVLYPWYLLWLLPFLTSASTLPVLVWTVSVIPTYLVWHLRALGHLWLLPGWVMLLEYAPIASVGAIIAMRHIARPSLNRSADEPLPLKSYGPTCNFRIRKLRSLIRSIH